MRTIHKYVAVQSILIVASLTAVVFNGLMFEWVAVFQWKWFLYGVGGTLLILTTLIALLRRYVLPSTNVVMLTAAALSVLIWLVPLSPRTRFFAAVSRIPVGTTQAELQRSMAPFPLIVCDEYPVHLPPEVVSQAKVLLAHRCFTGTLLVSMNAEGWDAALIELKDGRVTHVCTYAE